MFHDCVYIFVLFIQSGKNKKSNLHLRNELAHKFKFFQMLWIYEFYYQHGLPSDIG